MAQWVKDLAFHSYGSDYSYGVVQSLAWELPHAASMAKKYSVQGHVQR